MFYYICVVCGDKIKTKNDIKNSCCNKCIDEGKEPIISHNSVIQTLKNLNNDLKTNNIDLKNKRDYYNNRIDTLIEFLIDYHDQNDLLLKARFKSDRKKTKSNHPICSKTLLR